MAKQTCPNCTDGSCAKCAYKERERLRVANLRAQGKIKPKGNDMPQSIQKSDKARFDYNALDKPQAARLRKEATAINAAIMRTQKDILEIGQRLHEVQGSLAHGDFQAWIGAEFEMSYETASRFMRVWEAFKSVNLTDLRFQKSALYALSAPSVSDETRAFAVEYAETGETVTNTVAQEIITTHREPSAPEPDSEAPLGSIPPDPRDGQYDGDGEPHHSAPISGATQYVGRGQRATPQEPEIVHDTLTPAQNATESKQEVAPPSPEDYAIYRVLRDKQHRGIAVRRAILDWLDMEKAVATFAHHVRRSESFKGGDNTPFARAIAPVATLSAPSQWGICPPCKGNGCARCGQAGYEIGGGIDPARVEAGEVEI